MVGENQRLEMRTSMLAGFVLSAACFTAHAQSYFIKADAEGHDHWISHPVDLSPPSNVLVARQDALSDVTQASRFSSNARKVRVAQSIDRLLPLISESSMRYGIEPALVLALIEVESDFNSRATSTKGALGLMQIMPGTAQQYGIKTPTDLFRPEVNINIGVRHLKALLDRHQSNWALTLAAYNAGEGAVLRSGSRIPGYRETLLYVPAILTRAEHHRLRLSDHSPN